MEQKRILRLIEKSKDLVKLIDIEQAITGVSQVTLKRD